MEIPTLIRSVSRWIHEYAEDHRIHSLVVGVSGGLDSAVVTRLCELANADTQRKLFCIAMPMWLHENSDPTALQRAQELCVGRPCLDFQIREIGGIVEAYKRVGVGKSQLGEGNLRSRIRANILYSFANENYGIVVGTGNLDEDAIGYFTKGGDGLVDICPLSKIHKSVVRKMALELGVPQSIIDVLPTAGLWDGQTDEQELGMTYDEIEWAIDLEDSGKVDLAKTCNLTLRECTVLGQVRRMRHQNTHKLAYPPIFDPSQQ